MFNLSSVITIFTVVDPTSIPMLIIFNTYNSLYLLFYHELKFFQNNKNKKKRLIPLLIQHYDKFL